MFATALRHLVVVASVALGVLVTCEPTCGTERIHECICEDNEIENYHGVKCINTSLTSIPDDLPSLTEMTFEGNHFQVISQINYPGLKTLLLNNNHIQHIEDDAFKLLVNLNELALAHNELTRITEEHFTGLIQLEELLLSQNPLYALQKGLFSKKTLPRIKAIKATHCQLYSIDNDTFDGVSSLLLIDLSNNLLTEPPIFKGGASIQAITLSVNKIKSLSKQDLGRYPFDGLRSVGALHLDYNELSTIGSDAFRGLTKLARLTLNNNKLTHIEVDSFAGLSHLDELDLHNNELVTLSSDHVNSKKMSQLILHHNNWHCGCDTAWMLTDRLVKMCNPKSQMKCYTPAEVRGRSMANVMEVNEHVYDCPDPHHGFHSNTIALAVGLVVAVILSVFGSVLLYKLVLKRKLLRRPKASLNSSYSRVQDSRGLIYNEDGIIT